jgi:hypothetical protein
MNIKDTLQLLDIQEVTTKQQKKNGTREFKLPVRDQYGAAIHVASFASGYVRRTKAGGYCPSWQINKRVDSEPIYYPEYKWVDGEQVKTGKYNMFKSRMCTLIHNEQDRLKYLISFCLKNYYIGYANKLSSGEFVPKWKYDDAIKLGEEYAREPDVKVIVNGHRYNLS